MTKKMLGALALAVSLAGPALAQTTSQDMNQHAGPNASPACNNTKAIINRDSANGSYGSNNTATTMANTSSDGAMTTTGASSAAIGTGKIDKEGVHSPCATGDTARGTTGALPNSTPNTPSTP